MVVSSGKYLGQIDATHPMFTRVILAISVIGSLAIIGVLLMSGFLLDDNRPSAQTLANGRAVYREHCASCHGANLEGQPDWQTPLPSGRLPAPPHDASGHTWHHSDRVLFEITKYGTAAVVGRGYESDMPGFSPALADNHIREVLAFIKSTWPERERRYQQEMTRRDVAEKSASKDGVSEDRP
jgi:mono/diheme cytochrome c family protein